MCRSSRDCVKCSGSGGYRVVLAWGLGLLALLLLAPHAAWLRPLPGGPFAAQIHGTMALLLALTVMGVVFLTGFAGLRFSAVSAEHESELRQANQLGSKQTRATVATLLIPAREAPAGGLRLASYQAPATEPAGTAPAVRRTGAPTQASARLGTPDLRPKPSVRTHTIRQGDTLYSLARRYNTSVDALRKLNNLKSSSLSTGQRLRVPGTDIQG